MLFYLYSSNKRLLRPYHVSGATDVTEDSAKKKWTKSLPAWCLYVNEGNGQ